MSFPGGIIVRATGTGCRSYCEDTSHRLVRFGRPGARFIIPEQVAVLRGNENEGVSRRHAGSGGRVEFVLGEIRNNLALPEFLPQTVRGIDRQ